MQVWEIMTPNPACCTSHTNLNEVAQMMVVNHCGAIPVIDNAENGIPIGIVTDRDIACRAIAEGLNPVEMTAGSCMSSPLVTVHPDSSLLECSNILQENCIRRLPVVSARGMCVGIVTLADLVERLPVEDTVELVQTVSLSSREASHIPL